MDYVDDSELRHFVQQALNRGEAYHQLRRAIASINGNQFRGGDDYQIEQWNDFIAETIGKEERDIQT